MVYSQETMLRNSDFAHKIREKQKGGNKNGSQRNHGSSRMQSHRH